MSSLWTPSGEHFPKKEGHDADAQPSAPSGDPNVPPRAAHPGAAPHEPSPEEAQAAVDAMREQLAHTPAEVVVANHCYGLFELAAIYLSQSPPMLYPARLAIDALGAVLDTLQDRLGEAESTLRESLAQARLAYVRLEGAERTEAENTATTEPD